MDDSDIKQLMQEIEFVLKRNQKVFVIDAVDIIWDWLFAHDLLVSIVSSIIGSVFGVWLAFEFVIPLITQR